MPRLSSEDLVWDIRYSSVNTNWYYYRMTLHWKGIPVVNPATRNPSDDGSVRDAFGICNENGDALRHIFDYALATGRPAAWDAVEQDSLIAIYPGMSWPFCDFNMGSDFFDSSVSSQEHVKREKSRLEEAFAPAGIWTLMIFIDSEWLKGGELVSGSGIIMTMSVERQQVEQFRKELEQEYEEFSNRIGYRDPENHRRYGY